MTDFLFSRGFTLSALAAGAIAYVVYFDYRRRSDPAFRKYLKTQNKLAAQLYEKAQANASSSGSGSFGFGAPTISLDWDDDFVPANNAEREEYFMKHLQIGETLLQSGPAAYESAAMAFYRAVKVFPDPESLLGILQQKAPAQVTQLIFERMRKDVESRKAKTTPRIVEEGVE